jgi:hypothetical protein
MLSTMVAERRSRPRRGAACRQLLRRLLGILLLSSIGQSPAMTMHADDQEPEVTWNFFESFTSEVREERVTLGMRNT